MKPALILLFLLGACATIPNSEPLPSGEPTPAPYGCEDLRDREGENAC